MREAERNGPEGKMDQTQGRAHAGVEVGRSRLLGIGKNASGAGAQRDGWAEEWPGWAWRGRQGLDQSEFVGHARGYS